MPSDDFDQHLKSLAQELGLLTCRMAAFDIRIEELDPPEVPVRLP